jgi:hypothetical protein
VARPSDPELESHLWRMVVLEGLVQTRRFGRFGVEMADLGGRRRSLSRGSPKVRVTGAPGELLMSDPASPNRASTQGSSGPTRSAGHARMLWQGHSHCAHSSLAASDALSLTALLAEASAHEMVADTIIDQVDV